MLISTLAVILSAASLANVAYAHFVVEDTKTGVKAIFHVTPDHDPIAGKQGVISFDFSKTGLQGTDYSYALTVKSTRDEAVAVPIDVTTNVVLANYTFPSQGFYDITLTATRKSDNVISKLRYGQRVSRGVIAKNSETTKPLEVSMIIGAIVIAIGAVIFSLISDSKKRKEKRK